MIIRQYGFHQELIIHASGWKRQSVKKKTFGSRQLGCLHNYSQSGSVQQPIAHSTTVTNVEYAWRSGHYFNSKTICYVYEFHYQDWTDTGRRLKKTSKLRVTGLCEGNSPVASEFLAQRASNAENVSIWWRHHHGWPSTQPGTCTQPCPGRTASTAVCIYVAGLCASCPAV